MEMCTLARTHLCNGFLLISPCWWNRLHSIQFDLGQQIKVDFERAFSVKGAPVSVRECVRGLAEQHAHANHLIVVLSPAERGQSATT